MADVVSLTGVQMAFAHLAEPFAFQGGTAKYSALVLIPKDNIEALAAVNKAIAQAQSEFHQKNGRPFTGRTPLKDGAENTKHPEFESFMTFNAATSLKAPPVVVDEDVQPITSDSEFYPGIGVRVVVRPYSYDVAGNSGISFALNGVQVVDRSTDRLEGGNSLASMGFEPVQRRTAGDLI